MSDQGKWFKLWESALDDQVLENLSIHEWFCWVRLGAYIKRHGKDGKVVFAAPARALTNLFRVSDFLTAIDIIKRLPNCRLGEREVTVTGETNRTVTIDVEYLNWYKYQGDFSGDRVRRFRDKKRHHVTAQEEKRREETRRDKTRQETPPLSPPPNKTGEEKSTAYSIPEKGRDPNGYLVMQYKIRKIGQEAFDDREWDANHWARAAKAAKALITIVGGAEDAKTCLTDTANAFEEKNLSWTLETVVKWAHEWRATRRTHGLKDSQRFVNALAKQRETLGPTRVGEPVVPEPGAHGFRDRSPLPTATAVGPPGPRTSDERSLLQMVPGDKPLP